MEISNGATIKLFYGSGRVLTSTDITVPKYEENFTFYINQGIMNNDKYLSHDKTYGSINLFYDVWGRVWDDDDDDDSINGKNFTGYTYDRVIGKYFAQYRFYDAVNKRFMAVDPVKDGLNWYAYVNNNPASFVDPLGLEQVKDDGPASNDYINELNRKHKVDSLLNINNTNAKEKRLIEPSVSNPDFVGPNIDDSIRYDIYREQTKNEIINSVNTSTVQSELSYVTIEDSVNSSKDSPQDSCERDLAKFMMIDVLSRISLDYENNPKVLAALNRISTYINTGEYYDNTDLDARVTILLRDYKYYDMLERQGNILSAALSVLPYIGTVFTVGNIIAAYDEKDEIGAVENSLSLIPKYGKSIGYIGAIKTAIQQLVKKEITVDERYSGVEIVIQYPAYQYNYEYIYFDGKLEYNKMEDVSRDFSGYWNAVISNPQLTINYQTYYYDGENNNLSIKINFD